MKQVVVWRTGRSHATVHDFVANTQQGGATLSRNFVAQQSCLSDIAICPTFDESSN